MDSPIKLMESACLNLEALITIPKDCSESRPLGISCYQQGNYKVFQFFTESDPSVERLKQEREAMLQYINQTGGGLISIAGGGSEERNREILLNYKELQRTAMHDSTALTAMESELLALQIQKAQERQPWELISTPTVLDKPVAPQKGGLLH